MKRHSPLLAFVKSNSPKVDTPIIMKDATLNQPPITDEQYQAEAEILLAQIRALHEESKGYDEQIEVLRRSTRANLDALEAMLNPMKQSREEILRQRDEELHERDERIAQLERELGLDSKTNRLK